MLMMFFTILFVYSYIPNQLCARHEDSTEDTEMKQNQFSVKNTKKREGRYINIWNTG